MDKERQQHGRCPEEGSDPSTKTAKGLMRGNRSPVTGVEVLSYTFLRRAAITQHELLARLSDFHTGIRRQGPGCVTTNRL